MPFRARTHGFASHPDVIVAAMIASRLGVEHVVTEPRPAAPEQAPDEADLLARLRSAVLVCDGMLSAFENLGRPDPQLVTEPVQTGGHGGELLRGGYAAVAWTERRPARAWSEARGAELFRRMVTRRLGLLRPAAAGAYLASLAPFAAELPRGTLRTLDEFYLVNRAGRWSAAARQAYLIRSPLVQPLFADRVVLAARAVPLRDRITDRLHRGVLAVLSPELLELPRRAARGSPDRGSRPFGPRQGRGGGRERPARPTGGGPTGIRWPAYCAITLSISAPRAGCSISSGGRRGARAAPAAAGLAYGLGPGHPGRAALGRLAERPRLVQPGPGRRHPP